MYPAVTGTIFGTALYTTVQLYRPFLSSPEESIGADTGRTFLARLVVVGPPPPTVVVPRNRRMTPLRREAAIVARMGGDSRGRSNRRRTEEIQ